MRYGHLWFIYDSIAEYKENNSNLGIYQIVSTLPPNTILQLANVIAFPLSRGPHGELLFQADNGGLLYWFKKG